MFRVHTPIIRSTGCWVAAYGFLHRIFGWVLQLYIQCSWWWAYVPEICRAKNTLIKLPCCIKLAFQVILCIILTISYIHYQMHTVRYKLHFSLSKLYMFRHRGAILREYKYKEIQSPTNEACIPVIKPNRCANLSNLFLE